MRIQTLTKSLDYFFLISTAIFLALGATGIYRETFLVLGTSNALIAIAYKLIQNAKLEIPKTFTLFTVFLGTLLIHTIVTKGLIIFFWEFFSGGLFWLMVYNLRNLFSGYFNTILIILGLLMGSLYFYSLIYPINIPSLVSLFSAPTNSIRHSDLGDLWAIVLTAVFYLVGKKRNFFYLLLIIAGGYFLYVSFSRTALVALTVGIVYVFQKLNTKHKLKKELLFFLLGISVLFIYASMSKTVLFSRPYFLDALAGVGRFPWGTGMGNFSYLNGGSNLVHNILLEVLSGMGIFSIIFFIWLYAVLRNLITDKNSAVVPAAVFLAILADFFFNTTYSISAFVWLWFIALGLI